MSESKVFIGAKHISDDKATQKKENGHEWQKTKKKAKRKSTKTNNIRKHIFDRKNIICSWQRQQQQSFASKWTHFESNCRFHFDDFFSFSLLFHNMHIKQTLFWSLSRYLTVVSLPFFSYALNNVRRTLELHEKQFFEKKSRHKNNNNNNWNESIEINGKNK